jgi:hypothetical protein
MKTKSKMFTIIILLIVALFISPKKVSAQDNYISFQVFYDQLSPYGQWMDNPDYGYVWFPDAGSNFVPYSTGGYWIMTDYGWTWASAYNWGWAPFHYGRWDYDNYYGWFWIPDYEWGPAWVNWRSADGYYGWSPMGPGVSVSLSFSMGYNDNHDHWIFVRDRNIGRSNINHYYVNQADRDRIIVHSTVINNTYVDNRTRSTYVSGPARDDVQRATGRRVSNVAIQESQRPEQKLNNGSLRIYRPQVTRNNNSDQKYAPTRVMDRNVPERSQRSNGTNQQRNVDPANTNHSERQPNNVNQQDNNSNFNNTYKNNGTDKAIKSIKSEPDKNAGNNNFNNTRRNSERSTKSNRQQEAGQSQQAESKKQSTPSRQTDSNNNRRQRKAKSEENKN